MPNEIDIAQPNYAQRFFGEKIVSGSYRRALLCMIDEEGRLHVWNGCPCPTDAIGLVKVLSDWADGQTPARTNIRDADTGQVQA